MPCQYHLPCYLLRSSQHSGPDPSPYNGPDPGWDPDWGIKPKPVAIKKAKGAHPIPRAAMPPAHLPKALRGPVPTPETTFPCLLYNLVSLTPDDVIAWTCNGRAFKVYSSTKVRRGLSEGF